MRTFEKWDQLENKNCRVTIRHTLFGEQQYDCDMLKVINDERRIGVVIKGQELFVNKEDVVDFWIYDRTYRVCSAMTKISIVKKM